MFIGRGLVMHVTIEPGGVWIMGSRMDG